MGIFSALFSGVNGINSNGSVISVIGDNISNVNTVGYKASRATFEDIVAGSESNIGLGSRVATVDPQLAQGGFESASNVTDMAIDGRGFFVVEDSTDGSVAYTRAGQFHIDKDGYIVNTQGDQLQGYTVTDNAVTSNVDAIQISTTPISPNRSTKVYVKANLNSNSDSTAAFSSTNPTGTSNFSAGITVYDSLGNSHLVTVYFRKSASNTWQWFGLVPGSSVGQTATNVKAGSGTITFTTSGVFSSVSNAQGRFSWTGGLTTNVTFDFGQLSDTDGDGGLTQFGSDSGIINITQNGYASGSLNSIEIGADGTITGNYTNGRTLTISQIVVATFNNEAALSRGGHNNYLESLESGTPLVSGAGSSGRGNVVSNTLEQSNVDLASELIRMVIIQRGFQANSRTISTVNDMLAQLVTLGQG